MKIIFSILIFTFLFIATGNAEVNGSLTISPVTTKNSKEVTTTQQNFETHLQPFDDWLGKYIFTKEKASFDQANVLTENNILPLKNNTGTIEIAPRGFAVLEVGGLDIEVATHQQYAEPELGDEPYYVEIDCEDSTQVWAASIQIEPGAWQAYIYSTSESKTLEKISLSWKTDNDKGTVVDKDYPYEFSVPVQAGESKFSFMVEMVKKNGEIIRTKEAVIGVVK